VENYLPPEHLHATPERVAATVASGKENGEEMTADLARLWLEQHAAVNGYIMTSTDQFLNIRGGAGVGKTFAVETLIQASLDAGRSVALVAPYGEQSRVALRGEAAKAKTPEVAQAFGEADTVAVLLTKAQFQPRFRESLMGADIYVDEASLLDNQTMLGLIRLAQNVDARVILQGDTQQLHSVGRGQPLAMLEKELKLGMHIGRIDVTRRQQKFEDKKISQELSSGDAKRFSAAMEKLVERGSIKHGGIEQAVEAILANKNAVRPVETIVLSSTQRIGEQVSDKLHEAHKQAKPDAKMTQIAAFKLKALEPAELLSTASYKSGEMIEFKLDGKKHVRMAEVAAVRAEGIRVKGQQEFVKYQDVSAAYSATKLERGEGETLLLTQKIKQDGKVFENGSRQIIASIEGEKLRFKSGLELRVDDGRVRQGDALTTYKSQGASKTEMIRVEDNRSLVAMANQEDLHVAFTRHRATARMFVQDVDVLRKVALRTSIEPVTARELSRKAEEKIEREVDQNIGEKLFRLKKQVLAAVERRRRRIYDWLQRRNRSLAIERRRTQGVEY
jgi:hypothetical protein